MFRHRVRPPTPPLDEATAELLLSGAPIEDLPDAFRPVAQLLAAAAGPATPAELEGSAAAAAEFIAAHDAATRPRRRHRSLVTSVLTLVVVAASAGAAFATTQGALPDPLQQAAHEALGVVGISVPSITSQGDEREPSDDPVTTDGRAGADGESTPGGPAAGASSKGAKQGAQATDPGTGAGTGTGTGSGAGEAPSNGNPHAGEGNPGQGTPPDGAGSGNPANPGQGPANPGQGPANPANPGQGPANPGAPETPGANLPSPSNGHGNGPPSAPPGQAKK